jgi:hypothetical protein
MNTFFDAAPWLCKGSCDLRLVVRRFVSAYGFSCIDQVNEISGL